jgi:replicative DNA helicase
MWSSDYERAQAIAVGSILTSQTVPPHLREEIQAEHFNGSSWGKMYSVLMRVFEVTGEVAYPDAMKAFSDEGLSGLENLERIHAAEEESYGLRFTEWPVRVLRGEAERLGLLDVIGSAEQRLNGGMASADVAVEIQRGISRVVQDSGEVLESTEMALRLARCQEEREGGSEAREHMETGFPSIDEEMRGLAPGEITLISGPTGHGKTSIAVAWMYHLCMREQNPGLFISLEMSAQGIMDRFIARGSGHTLRSVWDGTNDRNVINALKQIHDSGMNITDNSPRTITQVLALIEKDALRRGIKVYALDYIAEVIPDRRRKEDERNDQMFSRWVRALRHMAVTHNMHGLILCQNNKEGDLAESKSMSHVADSWYHFWREANGEHRLMVKKARRGPVGQTYKIHFDPAHQIMREMGRE